LNYILNNKFLTVFLVPFLLGAITILGFSPYNLTFINFFSFSILLFLIWNIKKKTQSKYRKKSFRHYFFYLGCAFGFGFFLFGNYWITISLTHDESFKVLIPIAFVLIPFFLSLFFGIAIFLAGPFAEKKFSFILIFSLIFSIFEFLRGNLLTGFPWNLIAYTWSWSIEFIQILSIIGTYAFSLVSVTFFCIPFIFFQEKLSKKRIFNFLILILIFVGNYFFGSNAISNNFKYDETINVKIISPNLSLKEYNEKDEIEHLEHLIKISSPEKDKKTIFIWPEGALHRTYLQDINIYADLFDKNFSENHLIILGINNVADSLISDSQKYYNSLVILNSKLTVLSVYNKINLVPFGEFLPIENFFSKLGFKKITSGYNSFSPGVKREIVNLGSLFNEKLILPLICYEIIYPGDIKRNNQFPDLAINISEDAWFGKSIGPDQHFTKAIYRAVEEGIFIARSANKGISAFINPNGKVIKSLNTGESGNIEFNFPHFFKPTFFSNYGNKIFYLIIFLYMFLILLLRKYKI